MLEMQLNLSRLLLFSLKCISELYFALIEDILVLSPLLFILVETGAHNVSANAQC